ncbi:tripartite ATP-independent periplasmic transporter DctQ component [Chondrocystis sp. NIES-4102]|nr:tripartite ATP-independent periplasmic transporter DctQ component [Chondrocystis sp. NIES-4102]
MRKLLQLARRIDLINEWIGRFTHGLVFLMVIVGVWNVLGRYLGKIIGSNLTSNALIEIQWYLFDLVFLLGAAYALKYNEHVRVDIFYKNWDRRRQALADFWGNLLFLIPFSSLLIYYSWATVFNSWRIREMSPDPGGLPRYPIKFVIIIGCFLLILQGISEAIKSWNIYQQTITSQGER